MNDKSLADAVVALGVGRSVKHIGDIDPRYSMDSYCGDHSVQDLAKTFVRSWAVAGPLMEMVEAHFIEKLTKEKWSVRSDKPYGKSKTREWYDDESLPRAIVEACVEALTGEA